MEVKNISENCITRYDYNVSKGIKVCKCCSYCMTNFSYILGALDGEWGMSHVTKVSMSPVDFKKCPCRSVGFKKGLCRPVIFRGP